MPQSESYAADFTTANQTANVICGRGDGCSTKVFPPGTKLHFLHSNDEDKPGREVCSSCYAYYKKKTTTKRLEGKLLWFQKNLLVNNRLTSQFKLQILE